MESQSLVKLSKAEGIHRTLQERILQKEWAVGDCLPTEIDLAAEFGCSRVTIAKAVAFLVQAGLVERRKRGGTRILRNSLEPKRRGADLDAFACIYSSEKHEGAMRMLNGFQDASQEKGRRLVLLPTGLDPRREVELLSTLSEFDVRGAVACPVTSTPQEQLNVQGLLLKSRVPVVLMGAYHPGFAAGDVHLDHFLAGYSMARHLLDGGARKIGFFTNWSWIEFMRERLAGYRWAMREAAIQVPPSWVWLANPMHADFGNPLAEPQAIAGEFLDTRPDIEAVVCGDDYLAMGFIRAAQERGIRVPDDIKVTGMDNASLGASHPVPITTYEIPFEEIGRKSFQLLDDIVAGVARPGERREVCGRVIVRQSA